MGQTAVYKWFGRFTEDQWSTKDHLKKGRPSEPCEDRNIVGVPTGCLKGL